MTNSQEKPEKSNGVHLLIKNVGETPLQCIERFKKDNPEFENVSMTYAGRLDPMAEGLLLVLSGESILQKESYLGLPKTYECQILWTVSTDTADVLGLITDYKDVVVPEILDLEKIIQSFIGKFTQKYPAYSSQPVDGKPLFQWAREEKLKEIEIPVHDVELYDATFISRKKITPEELLKSILLRVSSVSGDFRQEAIIKKWKEVLEKSEREFVIDSVRLTVSSGFYVRQFISDVAEKFGVSATTYHILRTNIGAFHI